MKANEIYLKTIKFSMMKLGLGAIITAASILLMLICGGISALCSNQVVGPIMILVWFTGTCGAYFFVMNYIGYMIKAAYIAVIAEAVTSGQIPDDMVEYGKNMVKSRFGETNVYLILDKLVSGAISQLQKAVGTVGNMLNFIPGMDNVTGIVQKFIGISLGYIDECCLGYTFLRKDENPFKAACDGVVIYFQNAKYLLKNAAFVTLVVIGGSFLCWVVPFLVLLFLFRLLGLSTAIAVVLAVIAAICLKTAFIDSYMLVKMMVSYIEVAPDAQISYDLYGKLCMLSADFKKMFEKAGNTSAGCNIM